MINLHSQVAISPREIHYFDSDQHYKQGIEWYTSKLPLVKPGQIAIEKSPKYFITSESPSRMKRDLPEDTKLILIVRNPIDRLVSGIILNRGALWLQNGSV